MALIPALLAGTAALAAPRPTFAASEIVESGTTTYVVNTAKSEIDVTIQLSIKNNKPNSVSSCGFYCTTTTRYYWNSTEIAVETEAGPLKATSNAGAVKQSVAKTGTYYNFIKLNYPNVYYRQTRTITVSYAIAATPGAKGGFRAGKAYASLCEIANGYDSGVVKVVIPDGFAVDFNSGTPLDPLSDKGGLQTFSSGTISDTGAFWSCVDASNSKNLTGSTVTTPDQMFQLQAWPEDAGWSSSIGTDLKTDTTALESLTGLKMPGGTIMVQEAGSSQLGEYVGAYDSKTKTATVTEDADQATVAHELAHIWFNPDLFAATWMDEGFAGYSEKAAGAGNYKPCLAPGAYPGTGSPDLTRWKYVDVTSTDTEVAVTDWQYAASCYLVTSVADAMGPAKFKAVLAAASAGEIAYVGATPAEKDPNGADAVTAKTLLDLIDERGMFPAGVKDLDKAQKLFADYGILATDLDARSTARDAYHALATAAGKWMLPFAVRNPMATWNFTAAQDAMATATKIVALRDETAKNLSGFSLDGTQVQTMFEAAKSARDLAAVLDLVTKEAAAAAKVSQAQQLNSGSHGILQTIGLIGTDVSAPLAQAKDALKAAKPDDASASAQQVIDAINKSGDQGMMRVAAIVGLLLALLLLVLFLRFRGGRTPVLAPAPLPLYSPIDGSPLAQPLYSPIDGSLLPPPAYSPIDGSLLPPPAGGVAPAWAPPVWGTVDPNVAPVAQPPAPPAPPMPSAIESMPGWANAAPVPPEPISQVEPPPATDGGNPVG